LREELSEIPGITVQDKGKEKSGIVTFTHKKYSPRQIKKKLYDQAIHISVAVAGSALLDMKRKNLDEVARASVHYYNSEEELRRFCDAMKSM
jgi:selenocysteine lyase/cysteine desulfurase